MKHPLSCFAPSTSLAAREGNTPSAAGRPLRGGSGLGRARFMGCGWRPVRRITDMRGRMSRMSYQEA